MLPSAALAAPPALLPASSNFALPMASTSVVEAPVPLAAEVVSSLDCPVFSAPLASSVPISPSPPSSVQRPSWVSVLAEKDLPNCMPPARVKIHKGEIRSSFPVELLKDQPPLWSKFIAGYFIGDVSPHIGKVHATVNRLWTSQDKKQKIDAQFISPKVVLFKIEDDSMRRRVLQRHFWHVSEIPMIVQEWSPSSAGKSPDLSSIPLWVDFVNVPVSLFSKRGLFFLGNLVGMAQKIHPSTERCTRFDVARVLVEVNLNLDLPSLIKLDGETEISIPIHYPWLPPRCTNCSSWGHKVNNCDSMTGAALAGSVSENKSSPEKRPTDLSALASVSLVPAAAPAGPDDSLPPAQLLVSSEQVIGSPEHGNVSPVLAVPEQVAATPAAIPPPVNNAVELNEGVAHVSLPSTETEFAEQSWTMVSKSKGSPGRTIMTRGKCVAPDALLQSRYQPLGKELAESEDLEEGEIDAVSKHPSSSSDGDSSDDHLSQLPVVEAEIKMQKSTKKKAIRRKEPIKMSRQPSKSKKSSLRKA